MSTVLFLAVTDDGEATRVAEALRRRGRAVVWLDLAWFPQRIAVSAQLGAHGWEGAIDTPQ